MTGVKKFRSLSREETQKFLDEYKAKQKVAKPKAKYLTAKQIQDKKDNALREIIHKAKMKKLGDAYKINDRCKHIKSAGNGL